LHFTKRKADLCAVCDGVSPFRVSALEGCAGLSQGFGQSNQGVIEMTMIDELLAAGPAVTFHVVSALEAVVLAPIVLLRRRRDRLHKTLGYIWVTAMATTALSSFWISGMRVVGPYGPIHALSVFTLGALYVAIRHARLGNRRAHEGVMRNLAFWSLGVAGTLAFLPGRLMANMLFDEHQVLGFALVLTAAILAVLFGRVLDRGAKTPREKTAQ
jgi:uncharacterized membrane protein